MKKINRRLFTTVATLTTAALMVPSALAAQKVMKVATWLPPQHVQNAKVFGDLKKDIEAATGGRVSLKLEWGMGHPKTLFDLVEDGAADAAWSFNGFMPGRFTLPGYAEIPLYRKVGGQKVTEALWDTYTKHLKSAGEYDGLYLAAMWVHPPGQIHLKKPISSLNDLKGVKIRIGGGVQKAIADTFGVAGVAAPGSKVYEVVSKGVADGVFMPYEAQLSFKLNEVSPYVIELNMYYGVFSFVMSNDFLASLSDKDRKAVQGLVGRRLSSKTGADWQVADDNFKKQVPADKIVKSAKMNAEFKNGTQHLEADWLKAASKKSSKAEMALREYQALLK